MHVINVSYPFIPPSLSQQSFLFPTMPLNPPLNQVSRPSSARAAHVSGLIASQNKLSLMGVRQGEQRGRRGEGEERAVKTHHMLVHASLLRGALVLTPNPTVMCAGKKQHKLTQEITE